MNQLLKCVTEFIDEEEKVTDFTIFVCKISLFSTDNDLKHIFDCFISHPIEFTRLYEELTDHLFMIEDDEIKDYVEIVKEFIKSSSEQDWKKIIEHLKGMNFDEDHWMNNPFAMLIWMYAFRWLSGW